MICQPYFVSIGFEMLFFLSNSSLLVLINRYDILVMKMFYLLIVSLQTSFKFNHFFWFAYQFLFTVIKKCTIRVTYFISSEKLQGQVFFFSSSNLLVVIDTIICLRTFYLLIISLQISIYSITSFSLLTNFCLLISIYVQ